MRSLSQVSCSLNLGLIYSVDFSYTPTGGVTIKIYFVNESGIYPTNSYPLQKAFIQIGGASFAMYPIAGQVEYSEGRRVMWIEFIDDFFRLDHYYIALPYRGCGKNIITLGKQVDKRTTAEKLATAINPQAQLIKDFTQFPDYEYSFQDFISALGTKINISVRASYDPTITRDFQGTAKDVLSAWCSHYGFSFFFENGTIKIVNPSTFNISFPSRPIDAIAYNIGWDNRNTYGKTVCNWFLQNGGEYPLAQTETSVADTPANAGGPMLIRYLTCYPLGAEFNLTQTAMNLEQVAAAQYGQQYWFLYNYFKGTTDAECGWTYQSAAIYASSDATSITRSGKQVAIIDREKFDGKFQAYKEYGEKIAGRYYFTERQGEIVSDQAYTWYNTSQGDVFSFLGNEDKVTPLIYLSANSNASATQLIPGTEINEYYPGIKYVGPRIVYYDNYQYTTSLADTFNIASIDGLVQRTFDSLFAIPGSESFNFDGIIALVGTTKDVKATAPIVMPNALVTSFNTIKDKSEIFAFRFPRNASFKGGKSVEIIAARTAEDSSPDVKIATNKESITASGPQVISNTSVIKTVQEGTYKVYYDKYNLCASAASTDSYFGYKFDLRNISNDNQIDVTFSKISANVYKINRNYALINALVNNPYVSALAQARTTPVRTMSFSLNYFYAVPSNFLSNGLVGMNVSIGDNGITSTYSFSDEMLTVPDAENSYNTFAQNMKNSWLRTYNPKELIQ